MARFGVFHNRGALATTTPYLLDVQSELLQGLDTRVMVPLHLRESLPGMQSPANLMPMFVVESRECVMETSKLAAIPGACCARRSQIYPRGNWKSVRRWIFCSTDFERGRVNAGRSRFRPDAQVQPLASLKPSRKSAHLHRSNCRF